MRKIKRIAKFEGLEPRRCEDIKGIVVPDIGPKSFGTFEKQAPGVSCETKEEKTREASTGEECFQPVSIFTALTLQLLSI